MNGLSLKTLGLDRRRPNFYRSSRSAVDGRREVLCLLGLVEVERRSPLNWKFLEDDRPKRAINGSSVASKRSQIHEETAEFIDEHAFKKETNKSIFKMSTKKKINEM